MNLQKYKSHLLQNIKKKLSEWFDTEQIETVIGEEVYRFLHSVKGTSGTLELGGLMQISQQLLDRLDPTTKQTWDKIELKKFLIDFIEHIYEYENFDELVTTEGVVHDDQAPLIQIIDDDVSMLILLKDVLEEQGWMVMVQTDPVKAVKQYFDWKPDCLILDIQLPQKDGFEILQEIEQQSEKYFIPTIMISVRNTKEERIKAYQKGADDFFNKPIDIEEFVVKVGRHLKRKKIFDQSVLIDELTEVYNRKFLNDSLPRIFQDFKRTKQSFCISIVDLDFFKQINDTYGHLAGDQVLKDFARFLKQNIRGSDLLFRYGGEEFIIVFPKTPILVVKNRLNELIKGFSQKIFNYNGMSFSVSFSAGVFMVEDESITIEGAIKEADQLLYEAKYHGRARVECSQSAYHSYKKEILNISVIDDDIIIRTLLSQMLESLKINHVELNIQVFENGPAFLHSQHAHEDVNHFLLLDGMMPEMDGLEVLQRLKEGENADRYKVLMLTGRQGEAEKALALKLGADDYITKPFNMNELQVRIERILMQMKNG
ncbi:response regulator [Schinkia sp. CFF1]